MFFIVNHENSIIATDTDFLKEIGAETIYEAALLIKNGEIVLDKLEQSISYSQKNRTYAKVKLSTFLGDAYLYDIHNVEDVQDQEKVSSIEEKEEDALFSLAMPQVSLEEENDSSSSDPATGVNSDKEIKDEALFDLKETEHHTAIADNLSFALLQDNESIDTSLDNDALEILSIVSEDNKETVAVDKEDSLSAEKILGLMNTNTESSSHQEEKEKIEALDLSINEEPFISLTETDTSASNTLPSLLTEEEKLFTEETKKNQKNNKVSDLLDTNDIPSLVATTEEKSTKNLLIEGSLEIPAELSSTEVHVPHTNFHEISELIGISEGEYLHFLDDFKKESALLESNLRSNDLRESHDALSILKEASLLLHLPHITEKLNELSSATSDEKSLIINTYLEMVSRVSGEAPISEKEEKTVVDLSKPITKKKENEEEISSERVHEPIATEAVNDFTEHVTLSLDQIKSIPFDFSINEAAEELTLPTSLVSEFVIDFINQAKENLPVLQKAYEQKDMETIQTTAHMLKGASSNLRIVPLADTLYSLQFNDDLTQVPELIALFSGQLKALSVQMDQA